MGRVRGSASARSFAAALVFAVALAGCGGAATTEEDATEAGATTQSAATGTETTPAAEATSTAAATEAASAPAEATDEPTAAQADPSLERTAVRVAYLPVVTYAYLWQAVDAGYFDDVALDAELVPMVGGVAAIPAVEAGEIQFAGADVLGVLNAVTAGVPVQFVTVPNIVTAEDPVHGLMTNDPEVESAADLPGRTVAVNLQFNIEWLMLRTWLRQNEIDPESVPITEVPFPDMLAAVRDGNVSAAGMAEPFFTLAQDAGLRNIGSYWAEVVDEVAVSGFVANTEYLETNGDVAERFLEAINRAIDDINAEPDLARELVVANTEITPELASRVALTAYSTDTSPELMQFWFDGAREEGLVEESSTLTPADLLWNP